jgi:hypothetical protein
MAAREPPLCSPSTSPINAYMHSQLRLYLRGSGIEAGSGTATPMIVEILAVGAAWVRRTRGFVKG